MKTILVSGAGSGIGRSTAVHLAQAGHQIILLGRNREKLEETLSFLPSHQHEILLADITDRKSLMAASLSMAATKLDAIVACSGIGGINQWGDNDRWDEIIATNLTGTYNFVQTFYPFLQRSKEPYKQVLLIASAMSRIAIPGYQALSASKAGLLGLMRVWASQWAPENILVNAINPGWVNTAMSDEAIHSIATYAGVDKEAALAIAMQNVPLKKVSEPEEIAELIDYMLKQRSMTGEVVDINGGLFMNS